MKASKPVCPSLPLSFPFHSLTYYPPHSLPSPPATTYSCTGGWLVGQSVSQIPFLCFLLVSLSLSFHPSLGRGQNACNVPWMPQSPSGRQPNRCQHLPYLTQQQQRWANKSKAKKRKERPPLWALPFLSLSLPFPTPLLPYYFYDVSPSVRSLLACHCRTNTRPPSPPPLFTLWSSTTSMKQERFRCWRINKSIHSFYSPAHGMISTAPHVSREKVLRLTQSHPLPRASFASSTIPPDSHSFPFVSKQTNGTAVNILPGVYTAVMQPLWVGLTHLQSFQPECGGVTQSGPRPAQQVRIKRTIEGPRLFTKSELQHSP